ncbi:hypothetical protein V6N13_099684 [Hibiscus sabdariffa]|uniref:Uncharacterized protein n=2 Tax=Hibiscus sabdariffa TaxID=183260 RepID=A0ABR2A2S2_9ROSI
MPRNTSLCKLGLGLLPKKFSCTWKLEDLTGKVWRFRYSYWNSSQSYVLTKGWSRFVKEKNLNAGDIVSFQRSTGPEKQLYIDCKARTGLVSSWTGPVEMVRLFGVSIFKIPSCSGNILASVDVMEKGPEKWSCWN